MILQLIFSDLSLFVEVKFLYHCCMQEYFVKSADRVELMAFLGFFGAIISAIQMYYYFHPLQFFISELLSTGFYCNFLDNVLQCHTRTWWTPIYSLDSRSGTSLNPLPISLSPSLFLSCHQFPFRDSWWLLMKISCLNIYYLVLSRIESYFCFDLSPLININ